MAKIAGFVGHHTDGGIFDFVVGLKSTLGIIIFDGPGWVLESTIIRLSVELFRLRVCRN